MNRAALGQRNRRLSEKLHRASRKQRVRNAALRMVAGLPLPAGRGEWERSLLIRPDHLGDVLLTMPAVQALKQAQPDTSIHMVCGPWSAEVPAAYPEIDRVLTLKFPGFARGGARRNPYISLLQAARRLRQIGYDSAYILRRDHWWGACLAYLAGIPRRIGFDMPGVSPFLTKTVAPRHQHALMQNLSLVETAFDEHSGGLFRLQFPVDRAASDYIEGWLEKAEIPRQRLLICIHPGAGASSKHWSADNWAAVADALACQFDAAVVFTGTAAEASMLTEIRAETKAASHSLAGVTSVSQLAALYQRAGAVLGADSGAMHLAAAVDSPTVTLFGPADPGEFAPWGDARRHIVVHSDINCRPCRILDWSADAPSFHPCVRDIKPRQVIEAARRILQGCA